MIFILLAALIALTFLSYRLFKRDVLSPAVVLSALFSLCVALALYNLNRWSLWDYHLNTALLVLWGVVAFIGASYVVDRLFQRRFREKLALPLQLSARTVPIDWVKLALVVAFDLLALAYFWSEVRRIAILGGYSEGGLWTMMRTYRQTYSYTVLPAGQGLPWLMYQFIKLITVFAYVYLYQFINNVTADRFRIRYAALLVPVLLSFVQTLMNAGRMEILRLAAAALVMLYVLWQRSGNWDRRLGRKQWLYVGAFAAFMLGAFYLLANVVGRRVYDDAIYNLSVYTSGPVKLFDMFLQDPPKPSGIWGQETFYGIHQFLSKYFDIGQPYIRHLEFRSVQDINVGNIYSAFRRYYYDFGFLGLTVLQAINGVIFTAFYRIIKLKRIGNKAGIGLLLYAFIAFNLFMLPIDDLVYSTMVSVSSFTTYILLALAYWFLFVFEWQDVRRVLVHLKPGGKAA